MNPRRFSFSVGFHLWFPFYGKHELQMQSHRSQHALELAGRGIQNEIATQKIIVVV